jgi:hypothetical protein
MHTHCSPTTPQLPKQLRFGLFPVRSPLLRESLFVFSSSGYLDVSVLRVCVFRQYHFMILGCPIRKFTDQWIFPPPRNLSQVITSFIAFESQGILHAPLLTFFNINFNLLLYFLTNMSKNCIFTIEDERIITDSNRLTFKSWES